MCCLQERGSPAHAITITIITPPPVHLHLGNPSIVARRRRCDGDGDDCKKTKEEVLCVSLTERSIHSLEFETFQSFLSWGEEGTRHRDRWSSNGSIDLPGEAACADQQRLVAVSCSSGPLLLRVSRSCRELKHKSNLFT